MASFFVAEAVRLWKITRGSSKRLRVRLRRRSCFVPLKSYNISLAGVLIVASMISAGELFADSPELIRQYDFGQVDSESLTCQNEAPLEGSTLMPMRYVSSQPLTVIDDEENRSVRLDHGCFESTAFDVDPKQGFTVELLFRHIGHGSVDGGSSQNGMLFALGDGYWHGLRCYYDAEQKSLAFQIGRPQPSSAITASAQTTLLPGVWSRLTCSWDGRIMRVYLNGVFVGRQDHDGPFSVAENMTFRVGYAGAGVGSNEMDVAEVSVYNGALASDQIVGNTCGGGPLEGDVAERLQNALAAIESDENDTALTSIDSLLESGDLPEAYAAHLTYLKAELLHRIGRRSECVAQCLDVWHREDFDPSLRHLAGLRLIAPDPGAIRFELSSDIYRELLDSLELDEDSFVNASLSYITALTLEGKFEDAALACESLISHPDSLSEQQKIQLAALYGDIAPRWEEASQEEWISQVQTASEDMQEWERQIDYRTNASHSRISDSFSQWQNCPIPELILHVSPDGDDESPGSETEPFQSLPRARNAIRTYVLENGSLPLNGAAVLLHEGDYPLSPTFTLEEQDSGEPGRPIRYCAFPSRPARFSGGIELSGFTPVSDAAILTRLPEKSRGLVYQCDLPAQGVTDLGQLNVRGMGGSTDPVKPWVDIDANGKAMPLARWPNPGESELTIGETYRGAFQTSEANGPAEFACSHPRFERWREANDIWMDGMWGHLWAAKKIPVERIDIETGRIHAGAGSGYGVRTGQPLHFINLLEEIDKPGEWYLDRDTGMLYFYPPDEIDEHTDFPTVHFPVQEHPFITMNDVHNVAIIGLSFELNRSDAIIMKDCEDCMIAGCSIRRMGGNGIVARGGHRVVLACNDLISLGAGGVRIFGGDRATLTPSGHVVFNCVIEDFARVDRSYAAAIHMDGVGIHVGNNRIGNSPHYGIRAEGDLHMIMLNEFHHLVLEFDDQAAIDMWGDPTYRGNWITDNYFHDIGSGHNVAGQSGIRLDDAISSTVIAKNIFERSADGRFGAVQIHGGKDNAVMKNLFIDCQYAVSFSAWGEQRWAETLARPDFAAKIERGSNPLRLETFPDLADIPSHADRNFFIRNFTVGCGPFTTRDRGVNFYRGNLSLGDEIFESLFGRSHEAQIERVGVKTDLFRNTIPPVSLPD
jgi:hypothetical protein